MKINLEKLIKLLEKPEGENLEFKEARTKFDKKHNLPDYCAALANEGGGRLLLGVNNLGKVVGSNAFDGTFNKLSNELFDQLRINVEVDEIIHPDGRVLIFTVPSRLTGQRIKSTGNYIYPMRRGDSLVEMDDDLTTTILNERAPDFSATIAQGLTIKDLDPLALEKCRELWSRKSNRPDFLKMSFEEMLRSLSLINAKGLTYAALILLGRDETLTEFLPDSEVIFEWRQIPDKTAYDARRSWRKAFLLIFDEIWGFLNERNIRFPFQEGFFQRDIWAFVEKPIREAVLNAIAHRNYTIKGSSTFISASPKSISIESPGNFLSGVTPENILDAHAWRNRRLAEALQHLGLVERSGQGLNDIFDDTIRSGKGSPTIREIKHNHVELLIPAQVIDPDFVKYLEQVSKEKQILLSLKEIVALEDIRTNGIVKNTNFRDKFLTNGLIDKIGVGKGMKYVLSHNYYKQTGKTGKHTKLVGLSREQNKQLILNHIHKNQRGTTSEFHDALPDLTKKDIDNILQELRREGKITFTGKGRTGFWSLF